ncbi:DNAJ heat shock N-terminal domain-containing protein [Striga asiatica]|uniref:DNAJ heat shock N-terminal domain-containing protein n=1 Tax=Striga asiatica TaxID=4170 RepID=A0A5A7PWI3_STRAF|nr:DNAJ heat shock N-terminal domain-containing protein [Striga asiatica]
MECNKDEAIRAKQIAEKKMESLDFEGADPEFNDFDKLREESLFEVNQIWARYDPNDGMPRFHAKVRDPFELSLTDTNHMFSHRVVLEKGNKRGSFFVNPKPVLHHHFADKY